MASIQKRPKASGGVVYRVAYRIDGKQTSRTFRTAAAAKRFDADLDVLGAADATRIEDEKNAGQVDGPQALTVHDWISRHIDALSGIQEGTRSDYRTYLRRDIEPTLGHVALDALNRETIGAWVNALAARGLSGKSIQNRHSLLSASLTTAVRAGHIPTNHAKGIRLPRTDNQRADMLILSTEQQNALVSCLRPEYRPLFRTLVLTGLRWGEATALTAGHVDLENGVLRVRQSWKHADGKTPILGPPKSRRGLRDVTLSPSALRVLAAQVAGKQPQDWLFTAPRGGPLRHNTFYDSHWVPAVSTFAGDYSDVSTHQLIRGRGSRPRIHDLRHTFASVLIGRGAPLTYLQHELGHESIQTTSDVYGHLEGRARAAIAAAIESGFEGLDLGLNELPAAHVRLALEG